MTKELSEVRNALREYQFEMEGEKRKFHGQVNALQDKLIEKQIERDQIAQEAMERQNEMQEEDQNKAMRIGDLQDELD